MSAVRVFAFLGLILLSFSAWYISWTKGLSLAYGDAMAHLNIARAVVDSMEPGLAQLGGVWLPLSHVLALPLIWQDWAWQSGFAGSLVSMLAFIASVWGTYRIVYELTRNTTGALVGAAAVAFNLDMLYLQTTALTEPLYVGLIVLSALAWVRYLKTGLPRYLLLLGLLGYCQVLARYDGWFVAAAQAALIVVIHLFHYRHTIAETFGRLVLYATPVAFGVATWLMWNLLIFGNPLYFALGPYSAHAQQDTINDNVGLITKGDFFISAIAYDYDVLATVGPLVIAIGVLGFFAYLLNARYQLSTLQKYAVLALLSAPVAFNVLALYLGFSIINLPDLQWNPSPDDAGRWFNVRYGIMALPLIALGVGLLASTRRIMAAAALTVVLVQAVLTYQNGIITVIDGTKGSSSFANTDLAVELGRRVQPGERVLLSTSYFNAVSFRSGIPYRQFIQEGVSQVWPYAVTTPEDHADWIVLASGDVGEPLHTSLIKNQHNRFLQHYDLVYAGRFANIYERKPSATAAANRR